MKALFAAGSDASQLAEIDEELMFHLRSRVEDNRAAGMSEDEAWDDARRRMGSYRVSLDECREVRWGSSRRMAWGMTAAAMLLMAGGWLVADWRAKGQMVQQLDVLATAVIQTAVAAATAAEAGPQDLEVLVIHKGQPIKGANVLLIQKTWPNNRYRQTPYHATTDDEGKAKFDKLIPVDGQFAIHVAVVHDGHTLTSAYHLFEAGKRDFKAIKPLTVAVGAAKSLRFRFVDADGKALANAHIAPSQRKTGKEQHDVYFDAAGPATVATNADGEVTLSFFNRGDKAEFFVTPLGRRATEATCEIPKNGDVVTVNVAPPQRGE